MCINTWAKQCINWCYLWHDYVNNWHTDQMYIDKWKTKYKGVMDLPDKGVNAGNWNIRRFRVTRSKDGNFLLTATHLSAITFHGLKMYLTKNGIIKPYPICIYNKMIYKEYIKTYKKRLRMFF